MIGLRNKDTMIVSMLLSLFLIFNTSYSIEISDKSSNIVLIKSGEDVYFRTYYDADRDLVQWTKVFGVSVIGDNKPFNFWMTYLIPNSNLNTTTSSLLLNSKAIHYCSDDSCPMNFNGSYIGANHGCSDIRLVTSSTHNKTVLDVGSEWIDNDSRKWYLLRVVDSSKLWFLSENIGVGDEWDFDTTINGNLVHSKNATHTDTIFIESYTYGQLEPAFKNQVKKLFIDNDVEIVSDGTYFTKDVKIEEHYEIVDPSSALEYVISQVGSSVQPDLNNGDSNVTLDINYYFDRFGGCKIDYTVFLNKLIDVSLISGIQAGIIFKGTYPNIYTYIPGSLPIYDGVSSWDFRTLRDFSNPPSSSIYLTSVYWENSSNPPYRYLQFLGNSTDDLDVSFVQSFRINKGNTRPELRSGSTNTAVFIPTTRKTYPYVINSSVGDLAAGQSYEIYAYRGYADPGRYSKNASSVFLYEDDGDVFLTCDYHTACNDTITLPTEFNNKVIEIIDKNPNIEILTSYIDNSRVIINSNTAYSYANLRILDFLPPENINIVYDTSSVHLDWSVSIGAVRYRVFRSTDPYSSFEEITSVTIPSYTDPEISGSTKYFYKVIAVSSE